VTCDDVQTTDRKIPRCGPVGRNPDVFSLVVLVKVAATTVDLLDYVIRFIASCLAVGDLTGKAGKTRYRQTNNGRYTRVHSQSSSQRTGPY